MYFARTCVVGNQMSVREFATLSREIALNSGGEGGRGDVNEGSIY